ncbi:hypothetical protein V8E54_006734 [Elaphomyces granulatus]|jgi:hypothetical protein
MEEIETIRDSEIATPGDVKNANEVLRAYQEGALSIEPGKVAYWFNGKQKTSFVNSLSIPFEEIIEWQRQEGEGKLWIEDPELKARARAAVVSLPPANYGLPQSLSRTQNVAESAGV